MFFMYPCRSMHASVSIVQPGSLALRGFAGARLFRSRYRLSAGTTDSLSMPAHRSGACRGVVFAYGAIFASDLVSDA